MPDAPWIMRFSSLIVESRNYSGSISTLGIILSKTFRWFFPPALYSFLKCLGLSVLLSWRHKGDPLYISRVACVWLSSLWYSVLQIVAAFAFLDSHLLLGFPFLPYGLEISGNKLGAIKGLTFVFRLLGITTYCLMFSVLKTIVLYMTSYFLIVSNRR